MRIGKIKDGSNLGGTSRQVLSSSGQDSVSNSWTTLTVNDIPNAVEDITDTSITYGRKGNSWVPLVEGQIDLASTKFEIVSGVPTIAPENPDAISLDKNTGKFYVWSPSTQIGYYFNGNQYAVMDSVWNTLGNPLKYAETSYEFTGPAGNVLGDLPVSNIGKVGTNYHKGTIYNVSLKDNSPLQDTWVNRHTNPGTIGRRINMTNGVVRFDYRHGGPGSILHNDSSPGVDLISVNTNKKFVLGPNCNLLRVDGDSYSNFNIDSDRHYKVEFRTTAGGFNKIYSRSGINNLDIQVQN